MPVFKVLTKYWIDGSRDLCDHEFHTESEESSGWYLSILQSLQRANRSTAFECHKATFPAFLNLHVFKSQNGSVYFRVRCGIVVLKFSSAQSSYFYML